MDSMWWLDAGGGGGGWRGRIARIGQRCRHVDAAEFHPGGEVLIQRARLNCCSPR